MLVIKGLRKRYAREPGAALDGIDLAIGEGEFVAVLGRSGAGKSTFIRCINGLVRPDEGSLEWRGVAIAEMKEKDLRRLRGRIGMIFQQVDGLSRMSVIANVLIGKFASAPRWRSLCFAFTPADREEARLALKRVGLAGAERKRMDEISGGQQQRVAIARVLLQKPELLLGDEPVSSLDPVTAEQIMRLLSFLHKEEGLTVILNLHDVELARKYAQRIVGISQGKIVFDGTPDQLGPEALEKIYPPDPV